MENKKLLVAMSGGVDSAAAALLLLKAGHNCTGITFLIDKSEESLAAAMEAERLATRLGIAHITLDAEREFTRTVKEYFVRSYESGGTPNPCVVCNREIKLGLLLRYGLEHGFDGVATGHYARTSTENGRTVLYRGADRRKDQSYVLAAVPEDALAKAYFPLGTLTKDEVRRIAAEVCIDTAEKKESQDICFIPDGDYAGFIERYRGKKQEAGLFLDRYGKILGESRGQLSYTVGQGRGLGIALGRKVYVVSKDATANAVVLGDEEELYRNCVYIKDLRLIGTDALPDTAEVKLRYAHKGATARVSDAGDGKVKLTFCEAQRAPSPGQLAVLYDGDRVLGSGEIL